MSGLLAMPQVEQSRANGVVCLPCSCATAVVPPGYEIESGGLLQCDNGLFREGCELLVSVQPKP
jgi:hypothetical protein